MPDFHEEYDSRLRVSRHFSSSFQLRNTSLTKNHSSADQSAHFSTEFSLLKKLHMFKEYDVGHVIKQVFFLSLSIQLIHNNNVKSSMLTNYNCCSVCLCYEIQCTEQSIPSALRWKRDTQAVQHSGTHPLPLPKPSHVQ